MAYGAADAVGCGDDVWICDDVKLVIDKSSSSRVEKNKNKNFEIKTNLNAVSEEFN